MLLQSAFCGQSATRRCQVFPLSVDFQTAREKYQAMIVDIKDCYERGQPVLAVDLPDRDEQLDDDGKGEKSRDEWREGGRRFPMEEKPDSDDHERAEKNKSVSVQREDEVLDVETPVEDVKNL